MARFLGRGFRANASKTTFVYKGSTNFSAAHPPTTLVPKFLLIWSLGTRSRTEFGIDLPLPLICLAGILVLMNEVTRILSAIEEGEPQAAEKLLPLVYDELRRLAAEK